MEEEEEHEEQIITTRRSQSINPQSVRKTPSDSFKLHKNTLFSSLLLIFI